MKPARNITLSQKNQPSDKPNLPNLDNSDINCLRAERFAVTRPCSNAERNWNIGITFGLNMM